MCERRFAAFGVAGHQPSSAKLKSNGLITIKSLVFAGGGTGGHLTPGLAVAETVLLRHPDVRIEFWGTDRPVERQILGRDTQRESAPRFEHRTLPAESLSKLVRSPFKFLTANLRACRLAARWLRERRPDAVVGLGGFACAPVVWAARRQRIPVMLLEQNVVPGRSVRWLSHWADRVCVSFPDTLPHVKNGIVTGNPVRREIVGLYEHPAPKLMPISMLILGGSLGAQPLNQALIALVEQRPALFAGVRVVHQTGATGAEAVRAAYSQHGIDHCVEPFFHDMAAHYREATLLVARAGATTLAEAACAGLPAVLVPYPQAAENHQAANAAVYAKAGAALVVPQAPTARQTALALEPALQPWLTESSLLKSAATAMRQQANPEAASRVIAVLDEIVR